MPNGRAIHMSTEQFCDMNDDDFDYLMAHQIGEEIENPFFDSVLHKPIIENDIVVEPIIVAITDITFIERISGVDLDIPLDIE